MISTSEAFAAAIGGTSRRFRARLRENGSTVSGELRRVTVHMGSCGASSFAPGAVFSSYAEITVAGAGQTFEGRALELQLGVQTAGGSYTYITLGHFTAGRPAASVYETSFTAYGSIDAYYTDTFEPPETQTIANIIAALQTQTGTTIVLRGLTAAGSITKDMTGLTCRQALAAVAGVLGGYATERNDGAVVIAKYSGTTTTSENGGRMTALPTFADSNTMVTGVTVTVPADGTEEERVLASGTPNVERTDPYMTQALFSAYAGNLAGLTYRAGTVRLALGDPRLEPWDVLAVTDGLSRTYALPCMSLVHTFDGGLATVVRAPGLPEDNRMLSVTGRALRDAQNAAAAASAAAEVARAAASAAEAASQALASFLEGEYADDLAAIQSQIDGKAETWYQSADPSAAWVTAALRSEHVGDLWYDTGDGSTYRWNGTTWDEQPAPDEVFDAIDGKAQIFINTPTPPYAVGDLWFNSTTSDIMTCIRSRETGSYTASDWQKRNKYTDDSALNAFLTGTYAGDIQAIQNQIDGKAETWYQSSDPSTAWTTSELRALHVGDLWYNTTNGTSQVYNGSGWDEQTVPDEVFDAIDGKAQIFVNTPTIPYHKGDLWFSSSTSDIMTCIQDRTTGSYTASDWQKRNKYTDDTLASTANDRASACRGVCATAAATAAKTVTSTNFVLAKGSSIVVYFNNANTFASDALTLNVNSTGAKTIYVGGAATSDSNLLLWSAGATITFTYDGTYWRVEDNPGIYYGTACATAAGTAAKTTTVNEVVIFKGVTVYVPMTFANTNSGAYLNVSSLGGRYIYYGTSSTVPTTANGHGWIAGRSVAFYFDGSFWRIGETGTILDADHIMIGTLLADRIKLYEMMSIYAGSGSTAVTGKIGTGSTSVEDGAVTITGGTISGPGSDTGLVRTGDNGIVLKAPSGKYVYLGGNLAVHYLNGIETYTTWTSANNGDGVKRLIPPTAPGNFAIAKTLWTNSSPTSAFAAQKITSGLSNLSKYDVIIIEFRWGKDTSYAEYGSAMAFYAADRIVQLSMGGYGSTYKQCSVTRQATLGSDGITFTTGAFAYGSGYSESTEYAIPTRIIGLRYTSA